VDYTHVCYFTGDNAFESHVISNCVCSEKGKYMVSSHGKGVVICCKTQLYSYMTSLELDDIILLEKVNLRQNLHSNFTYTWLHR
jgi:hypothetical protein